MWPIGLGDPFMTIFFIVHTSALFVVLFSSLRLHIIDLFNFFGNIEIYWAYCFTGTTLLKVIGSVMDTPRPIGDRVPLGDLKNTTHGSKIQYMMAILFDVTFLHYY